MTQLRRIGAWTRFTLSEYMRSGRIFVEVVASIAFIWLFLRRPNVDAMIDASQFFSMTALFVLVQTIYTTTMIIGLGQRAQGYVVLARPLGRRGYLLGLVLVPIIIATLNFVLLSLVVTVINKPIVWTPVIWAAGALPLLLDVALVTALVTLLSGLVLTSGWRLLVLAFVAAALLSGAGVLSIAADTTIGRVLETLKTILGVPLTPLLAGFELAATRLYSTQAVAIVLGQVALLIAVIAFALFAFDRRDVILN